MAANLILWKVEEHNDEPTVLVADDRSWIVFEKSPCDIWYKEDDIDTVHTNELPVTTNYGNEAKVTTDWTNQKDNCEDFAKQTK